MGRYYDGDISGKFRFGVQSSFAPAQFGHKGKRRVHMHDVQWHFTRWHLKRINIRLKYLEEVLGPYLQKYDKYFSSKRRFSSLTLQRLGPYALTLLETYEDYKLGIKIRDCVLETGSCLFWGD